LTFYVDLQSVRPLTVSTRILII